MDKVLKTKRVSAGGSISLRPNNLPLENAPKHAPSVPAGGYGREGGRGGGTILHRQ